MKQLGLHFASKQPKLMFRHFDIENRAAELTLKRVKPKRTQVLQKSSRNRTNSTVNADFRCQYTDAPFDCSVYIPNKTTCFQYPMK